MHPIFNKKYSTVNLNNTNYMKNQNIFMKACVDKCPNKPVKQFSTMLEGVNKKYEIPFNKYIKGK